MYNTEWERWLPTLIDKENMNAARASIRQQGFKFSNAAFKEAWQRHGGKVRSEFAREAGRSALGGQVEADPAEVAPEYPPASGTRSTPNETRPRLEGTRFVFTYAQNNTMLHEDFWSALQHFCTVNNASLGVSRGTYNIGAWLARGGKSKKTKDEGNIGSDVWYDDRIEPYVIDHSAEVADGLIFCGEFDISPSAMDPLSGLDDYTGPHSGIVPHTKMRMQSLATMMNEPAKFMYTTGACTLRNYIERKTGQVANYHHVFGALYVEVDPNGDWFCRQLNANSNGEFYDLDMAYGPGWHSPASDLGKPLVNLGDIHHEQSDAEAMLGAISMLRKLNPAAIFLHDLLDFKNRNHHNINDPYFLAQEFHNRDSVKHNIAAAADFANSLNMHSGTDATIYIIRSNHDQAFERWLKNADAHLDPVNAEFWHECNAEVFKRIRSREKFDVFEWAMRNAVPLYQSDTRIRYVKEDESIIIHGIEFGMHGHRGPNGARGTPKAFRQLGRKVNTGHTHSAGIINGIYTAGVLGKLDMGYNAGPSSWSHSHIITHPNGKRQIVTQRGHKWRA